MIWSTEAFRLPCICGRATLAMVVSSEFITVANIKATVMGTRLATSWALAIARWLLGGG